MRRFLVMSARVESFDVQPENLLAFCRGNHLSLFREAYMVGLECWPVQSEGQEIDGQPSRPIDLVKSGHLSPSSIGVNDAPSFEGQLLLQRIRLAGGFSLRHPYVYQAPIDKQTDGSRAWDTGRGSPEFDAFEHLGRKGA